MTKHHTGYTNSVNQKSNSCGTCVAFEYLEGVNCSDGRGICVRHPPVDGTFPKVNVSSPGCDEHIGNGKSCVQCGGIVEPGRSSPAYANPTCHQCLPPPAKLPIAKLVPLPDTKDDKVQGLVIVDDRPGGKPTDDQRRALEKWHKKISPFDQGMK